MKILVFSQYFYPETFRVNALCAELVRRGHQVTVVTGYPQYPQGKIYEGYGFHIPYESEWNGVKLERVRQQPRGKNLVGMLLNCFSYVWEGNKWVKRCKEKFDAVYVFETSPVTVGLPAVRYYEKFGTPIFFNVQDLWPENVQIILGIQNKLIIGTINKIVDRIYGASKKILCASNSFVQNIANRGVPRDKLVYWPQFCREPALEGSEKPECYQDSCFNIVFTGNIGQAQGLELLVEAAARLKDTRIRWFIVGDGRVKDQMVRQVAEADLEDLVTFVGKVSEEEANRYIHHADCAYLSFKKNRVFEMTLPAKLQSYMACGAPILAAAGGETARVIQEADCGFVCGQDPEELCRVLREQVLSCDRLQQLRTNARTYYQKHFTMDLIVSQLEELMSADV